MNEDSLHLEKIEPQRVAYIELIGPYQDWGKGLMRLKALVDSQTVKVAGKPIGLFYDNPTETPAKDLRSDACFPIEGKVGAGPRFQVKELPGGEIALTRHVGPSDQYTKTYGSFLEGILKQGYMFYGPAREIFEEASADLSPGKGIQIQQLVKKS